MHPLTTWLALSGSVWALFALAEDHISPQHRTQVTQWLRRHNPHWPATFVTVCDSVFGAPAVSGASFLRACVASHIAAFLVLCLSGTFYPGTSGMTLLVLFLYAPFLLGSLALGNLLPGYVSLLVHRALLQRVSNTHRRQGLSTWLVLASIATGVVALLAWTLGFLVVFVSSQIHLLRKPVTWIVGYIEFVMKDPSGRLSALQEAMRLQPIVVPGMVFPSFGIWLYAPCFPFVWVWLYMLSGMLIRSATAWRLMGTPERAPGLLDIDTRPLHTLGAVAVGVVSVVYWIAVLWQR